MTDLPPSIPNNITRQLSAKIANLPKHFVVIYNFNKGNPLILNSYHIAQVLPYGDYTKVVMADGQVLYIKMKAVDFLPILARAE